MGAVDLPTVRTVSNGGRYVYRPGPQSVPGSSVQKSHGQTVDYHKPRIPPTMRPKGPFQRPCHRAPIILNFSEVGTFLSMGLSSSIRPRANFPNILPNHS